MEYIELIDELNKLKKYLDMKKIAELSNVPYHHLRRAMLGEIDLKRKYEAPLKIFLKKFENNFIYNNE